MKPVGIIGGTRFDGFVKSGNPVHVETLYGRPSSPIFSMEIGGRDVRFIYRHGRPGSRHPPQSVNYAANMKALHEAGCESVVVTTAVGDLISPENVGKLAVPDQLINYSEGRKRTLYDGHIIHVEFAYPYCNRLRKLALGKAGELGLDILDSGTVAVVGGHHFSTRAEHSRFRRDGCTLVGMTQYPEAVFARELEMCYAAIAIITDYAVGTEDINLAETTHADVSEKFSANVGKVARLLEELIPLIPDERDCPCPTKLSRAVHG